TTIIVAMNDGLDAACVIGRSRVYMGQVGDGWRPGGHGRRNRRQDDPIVGEANLLRPDLVQFVHQQPEQLKLLLSAGRCWGRLIALGVNGGITQQTFFKLLIKLRPHNFASLSMHVFVRPRTPRYGTSTKFW